VSAAEEELQLPVPGGGAVTGDLVVVPDALGVVVFAHGSGSSRHSPRNRSVAAGLQRAGMATLLLDLLTPEEEQEDRRTRQWRFDIPLLSRRLVAAVDHLDAHEATAGRPVGAFGASTGAAAALRAAAERPERVRAVVSRGGVPDLAGDALPRVLAPTLLIVGGDDLELLAINEQVAARLRCLHEIAVVPAAGHLFAEPGALEEVTRLATVWLRDWLPR
jgi:putative phosphoribosyl transferase